MTINNGNRRKRVRAEPLPESMEPLDPKCFVQQLSEVMGERKEQPDERRAAARRRKATRDRDRRWWDDTL